MEQVAAILSNICLISSHLPPLSTHPGVLRFLLLASNCSLPEVSSTAMDALLSLAPSLSFAASSPLEVGVPLSCQTPPLLDVLFHCMLDCINSRDRRVVLKG